MDYLSDYEKAVRAYFRWCQRNGYAFQQPSEGASSQVGYLVTVCNWDDTLASFNVRHSKLYPRK